MHDWIRGTLCTRCNHAMRKVDARHPGPHLQALLDHWANCPDCSADGAWSPGDTPAERPRRGGKRSVYLSDELAARWRATGLPLAEVIRRGLDTIEGTTPGPRYDIEDIRRVLREELARHAPPSAPPVLLSVADCE